MNVRNGAISTVQTTLQQLEYRAQRSQKWPTVSKAALANWAMLVIFVAVAVAIKAATFGNPDRTTDEAFYFLVGQRMHEGALPYVDIWDRKPLGLFLLYYVMVGISNSVVFYQVIACVFAGATAWVICQIAKCWISPGAGFMAGTIYLLAIWPIEGATGQSPDFYNLLIAAAAYCVVREMDHLVAGELRWPIWLAMGLCSLAVTIKQTSVFESIYFGLVVLALLHQAHVPSRRLIVTLVAFAAIGIFPTCLIAAYYWQAGHWMEFWHAMVTSNLDKQVLPKGYDRLFRIVLGLSPVLVMAANALSDVKVEKRTRLFLIGWIAFAVIGFFSVPNNYSHYALPVAVSLSLAAGLCRRYTAVLFVALALFTSLRMLSPSSANHQDNRLIMEDAASVINMHERGRGVFILNGPIGLYSMTNSKFLSPLVFPNHFNEEIERNTSYLNTIDELHRVLAGRPDVIVTSTSAWVRSGVVIDNMDAKKAVDEYVSENCRLVKQITNMNDYAENPLLIYAECNRKTG